MSAETAALADALAGNIRVVIAEEGCTAANVYNELVRAGVPMEWHVGGQIRTRHGRLRAEKLHHIPARVFLWSPSDGPEDANGYEEFRCALTS